MLWCDGLSKRERWALYISSSLQLYVMLLSTGLTDYWVFIILSNNRGLKHQRKRHLKREFALPQTLSRLFHLVQLVKCWQMFLEVNSKGLYRSPGKEKQSRWLVSTSSIKREIRHFYVLVVLWRQRNVPKSVMHMQSCCSPNCGRQEELEILISRLLLRMRRMYVAGIHLDVH